MIKRITICGGGGLGHVIAGYLASKGLYQVSMLTRRANLWQKNQQVFECGGNTLNGELYKISNKPQEVVPGSDMILICLPGSYISQELEAIEPYLDSDSYIGSVVSSNGFFFMAQNILGKNRKLFGFQRVPFVARVYEYGKSSSLLGYRKELHVATLGFQDHKFIEEISEMFDAPTTQLPNYLEAALTNSNPILHPSRLYALFNNYSKDVSYSRKILFYEEWDDFSSEILLLCDQEFQQVASKLNINISTLLQHYESYDIKSLTAKIKSIDALKGLETPMILTHDGYKPDFENRYFTEDIPYGLVIIKSVAEYLKISTPTIDQIIIWAQSHMNKEYLVNGELKGKDLKDSGFVLLDFL